MTLKLLACLVVLSAIPVLAQDTSKNLALTDKSNVPAKDILKALQKECPKVSITEDLAKNDYTLEAITIKSKNSAFGKSLDLTLFDRDGKVVRTTSVPRLSDAVKEVCQAINRAVLVEVVDMQNLTQSIDERGNPNVGLLGQLTGRRTHTDASTISIIVNGEHALLDCYERRKGCITIGPGKYYGELDADRMSIWVNFELPLTHKPVRDHYVIAGSW